MKRIRYTAEQIIRKLRPPEHLANSGCVTVNSPLAV
jgi:hypothetical protein